MIEDGKIYIVKFAEAHCFVGKVTRLPEGLKFSQSLCLKEWGADKGLGQLYNGPLPGTKLDLGGELTLPMHSVIALLNVDQKPWQKILNKHYPEGGEKPAA